MAAVNRRSVAVNPRNGSRRICVSCARWEPVEPSSDCSHARVATLDVNDRDFQALQGLAEAAVRAKCQHDAAVAGLALVIQNLESSGTARVQAQHVERDNVVSLHLARASVRVG